VLRHRGRSDRVLQRPAGLAAIGAARRQIGVLILVLIAAVVAATLISQLSMLRRSAEAPVTITSALLQPGGGTKDRQERGFHLRYTYTVDGVTHAGLAFVPWNNVAEHRPKVCLDPDDPRDHLLVDGSVRCGSGGFLR
jgi:hypothetical protein